LSTGHWAKGTLGQAYIEKNPLAALQAFAIASGWDQSSFMRRHFLGRALVSRTVHVQKETAEKNVETQSRCNLSFVILQPTTHVWKH